MFICTFFTKGISEETRSNKKNFSRVHLPEFNSIFLIIVEIDMFHRPILYLCIFLKSYCPQGFRKNTILLLRIHIVLDFGMLHSITGNVNFDIELNYVRL